MSNMKDEQLKARAVRMSEAQWEKLNRLAVAMGRMATASDAMRALIDSASDPAGEEERQPAVAREPQKRKSRALGAALEKWKRAGA